MCFVQNNHTMKNIIILSLIIGLFGSCVEKLNPEKLKNTNWELTSITGTTLPNGATATLNIGNDLKISGKSFCNNYGGQAEIVDEKVTLKNVFGTKMFCHEFDKAELAYLNALNKVNSAKIVNGQLQLLNDKDVLMVFTQQK